MTAYPNPASELATACRRAGIFNLIYYIKLPGWEKLDGHPFTIGWGSTSGVAPGMTITQEQADARLANDLRVAEATVEQTILYPLTDNMFAALVSLCFNVGGKAFRGSTLVKLLNCGKVDEATRQFVLWDKAGGRVNSALLGRRAAERQLFVAM